MNIERIFFPKGELAKFFFFFRIFAPHLFAVCFFFAAGVFRGFSFPFLFFFSYSFFFGIQRRGKGREEDVFSFLPPRSGRKRNRLVGRGSCNSVCGYGGKVLFCKENPRFFLPAFSTFPKDFRWTEFLITFPIVSTSFPQGKRAGFFHISTKEWGEKRRGESDPFDLPYQAVDFVFRSFFGLDVEFHLVAGREDGRVVALEGVADGFQRGTGHPLH